MEDKEIFKLIADDEMESILERALGIGLQMHRYAWFYLGEENARVVIEGAIWKAVRMLKDKGKGK